MDERMKTLRRLEAEPEDEVIRFAKAWLSREDTQLLTAREAHLTVYEAAHLWRVRQKINLAKGQSIFGAEGLLTRLGKLTPQKQLEQRIFSGPEVAGNLFFEKTNGRFVGAVIQAATVAPALH